MREPVLIEASWYDGLSAVRHEGEALWEGGDALTLRTDDDSVDVPLADLDHGERRGPADVYRRKSNAGFRLSLPHTLPPDLAARMPARSDYGAWVDKLGLGKAAAIFAVVSASLAAIFLTAPTWLGPRIPMSWERSLGEAMVGDFGGRLCHTPEGDAALAKLLGKVDPAGQKVRAGVANIDMVNAVALPGGQVLLFDGLIQQAESPEELAGVLGHEVGHVRERHVMSALLRQFGLTILLSGANSGVGDTVFGLASMNYSRDAEREADEYARARMAESEVSPIGAAGFFERIGGGSEQDSEEAAEDEGSVFDWVASHPAPGERARAYRNAVDENVQYRPALTAAEFEALKSMCEDDPDVEEFEFF